jgi:two-component system sensor histidine kinase/response regulator
VPHRIHVLVVDDNPDHLVSIKKLLESRTEVRYAIHTAASVREAENILKNATLVKPIDAVLLDLSLPDASGTEAVSRIKEAASTDAGPGIVVLTGWGDAEEPAKKAGADDFLTKPAEPLELSKRLQFVAIQRASRRKEHDLLGTLEKLGKKIMAAEELRDTAIENSEKLDEIKHTVDDTHEKVARIEKEIHQ